MMTTAFGRTEDRTNRCTQGRDRVLLKRTHSSRGLGERRRYPTQNSEAALFSFPEQFQWLPPWVKLPDDYATLIPISWPDDVQLVVGRDAIVAELRREMPEGHVLLGKILDAVAVHVECGYKDFVFTMNDADYPIAVVHLTYNVESDPFWPRTRLISSLNEWIKEMKLDYEKAGRPELDCLSGHYRLVSRQIENETQWYCGRCGERDAQPKR